MNYKIAIDISPLKDGNSHRGVGYYTQMLVPALQKQISLNKKYRHFKIELIEKGTNLSKYDLIHYPFFDPFFLTLPSTKQQKVVVTVHDFIPLEFKNHFPVGLKGQIKWILQKHRLEQSNFIITVSHQTKVAISKIISYPSDKIFVTYEAADKSYQQHYPQSYLQKIKKKYQLPDKFILNNGDINWNKNIPNLVKACLQINAPLIIVGKQALNIENIGLEKPSLLRPTDLLRYLLNIPSPQLKHLSQLKELFQNPSIHRLGYVPDEDLPAIYKLATVYCQPSFAEGFGLSLVKAMKVGTPIAYSQASCLPEIAGDSGLSFDPYSINSIAKTLQYLFNQPKLRAKLSNNGLQRSKIFDWKFTALDTLAVYQLALNDQN